MFQDEEDVVQSMGRSSFSRLPRRLRPGDRDALWALLVTITLNKVRNAADHHFAAKRNVPQAAAPVSDESRSDAPDEDRSSSRTGRPRRGHRLERAVKQRLRDLPEPDLGGRPDETRRLHQSRDLRGIDAVNGVSSGSSI